MITEDNGWLEGAAIMLAVIVVSSVASIQNWQKDREFYAMNKVKEDSELTVCFSLFSLSSYSFLGGGMEVFP